MTAIFEALPYIFPAKTLSKCLSMFRRRKKVAQLARAAEVVKQH